MSIKSLEPQTGVGGAVGYTTTQAQSIIGCEWQKYIRDLISSGKVKIVGRQMYRGDDSASWRYLLDVADVEKAATMYHPRQEDGARAYATRLTPEQKVVFHQTFKGVELVDLTAQRSAAQKKYHAKQRNERKAKRILDAK